jgi:hypothetical protein
MSTRRRKVTYFQVIRPLLFLFAALVIVLSVWTIIDPWQWTRGILIDVQPPESIGQCGSNHFNAFFWTCAALIGVPTLLTIIAVWRTKDISQDLSDTSLTFYLVVTQFQAWLLGVPVLIVLGTSSVDASYLGRALLIWLFAVAPLLIVICPTIFRAARYRINPTSITQSRRRASATGTIHVSGLTTSKVQPTGTFTSTDFGGSLGSNAVRELVEPVSSSMNNSCEFTAKPMGSSSEDIGSDPGDTSSHLVISMDTSDHLLTSDAPARLSM